MLDVGEKTLESFVLSFVDEHPTATLLEVTVDTTFENGQSAPHLNLWAWRVFEGHELEHAMQQAESHEDIGSLYDVLDGLGESCFAFPLASSYPNWPHGIEAGDQAIVESLERVVQSLPRTLKIWFHHVDSLAIIKISG